MKRKELIKKFIEFYESKNHQKIPNMSLIPENDPTVLFTTAGMHPLVPFLNGQKHPQGKRLVNVQKCIRTGDIAEVGDATHHTFFEMLGKWSLGDYWKEDAIKMTFEFYTKVLGIDSNRLAVTVFEGDDNASKDSESANIWKSLGISKIIYLKKNDNWWGPAGKTGPCGPDTEVFYWKSNEKEPQLDHKTFDEDWVEIGNDVLMEYEKDEEGNYSQALQKNIDFGGGVERTIATLQGLEDNYEADMWKPIISKIESLSDKKYEDHKSEFRIIADHIKAAVMIINDGISSSNTEQGYVLRRLIRRAIRFGRKLELENFTTKVAEPIYKIYDDYNLDKHKINLELKLEEERFLKTLEKGLKVFQKLVKNSKEVKGSKAFLLFQSYGFPLEMTIELAKEQGVKVDKKGYQKALEKHQELSRTATKGKFSSGLADSSEATTRLHTATHLLLAAMNEILPKPKGVKEILQKGSNITGERARFDFSYDRKLTEAEVKALEDKVNEWIGTGATVHRKEMTLEEARKFGAHGTFTDKYSAADKISVYTIGDGKISKEMCTGPHVNSLTELKNYNFKISKQKSVGAGSRRVKVILEKK